MNQATQEGKLDYIGANELVFNNSVADGISSGGFSVNSIMMKAGMSPIMTVNTQTGGEKVSDLFNSLVVPNWLLSYDNRMGGGVYKEYDGGGDSDNDDVSDDLHDKLLDLVREHESKLTQNKKKKTRRIVGRRNAGGTKRKIVK
jgi:hypothetical protein